MWSPPVPAALAAALWPGRCGTRCCCSWAARPDQPLPPLSQPGCGGSSGGLGKAGLPKLKWPPVPSERLGDLTPLRSLSQWAAPRPRAHGPNKEPAADTASGRALLVPPGPAGLGGMPGPPVFIPPPVPSSGLAGLPPLPPGSEPPSPPGPPWPQPGPLWDQACAGGAAPVPPSRVGPELGARNPSLLLLF